MLNLAQSLDNSPVVLGGSGGKVPQESWEVKDDSVEGLQPLHQLVGRLEPRYETLTAVNMS